MNNGVVSVLVVDQRTSSTPSLGFLGVAHPVHVGFVEKEFNCIPHGVLWRALWK